MKEIRTEINIKASAEKIWSIIMDFDQYPEWNPFILSIIGKAKVRERLKVTVQSAGSKPMVFKPQVTLFHRYEQFGWLGSLFIRGIFDGHHIFELKKISENETLFIHREEFSGILVTFLKKQLDNDTRAGFVAMNEKLKTQAEK